MLRALAYSIAALTAAAEQDVDRTDEDRKFFAAERDALQPLFDALTQADKESMQHALLVAQQAQARVVLGDAVLDRGVSKGKARMKVELKGSKMEDGADHVFGKDVSDLTEAERAKEPGLVLQALARFGDVPDFTGKPEMLADLTARADQQKKNFADRDASAVTEAKLDGALKMAISSGSDALYGLEKRLLDRFKREAKYVKAFFLDVAPPKKDKA